MKARYGPISLSPPLSMSLSRRSHLDLLRGLRPPLEPRVEVALEGLELRSEEHTSELQSRLHLVCRLLLEKKKNNVLCLSVNAYWSTGLLACYTTYVSSC